MDDRQRTLCRARRVSGIALHTGVRAHVTFKPGPPDSGIRIVRVDLPSRPDVAARVGSVVDVTRATTIACGDAKVHTVEHVLAALYACGVDNAVLEMDGPEPPIADGSSVLFIDAVRDAGVVTQKAKRNYRVIEEPLYVEDGATLSVILPCDEYRISCTVQFGVSRLDTQYLSLPINEETFAAELCRARTFCPYEQIEGLMAAGLIRGGSLDNSVVIKDGAIICKDELRYPDELVRHKMLDIVGDLSLVGERILGHVIAVKPGHPSNIALARRMTGTYSADEQQIDKPH